ncbi:AbgT family transporter [Pseudoflavonifractor phocaeensis]|uniref:AbgT family transporter n=1 Tax=Pseudoflavonifractor phocaeensis TaxID=1870988 RepID=UPI001F2D08D3|nr:AbgT family transporter [Pseudoflavonifractor phocaeensis]MCF2660774.1 AbgT family transporter [Pseudoflavonifractor phocaeensis]
MSEEKTKKGLLDRILDAIERVGNKLPDPITLFLGLAVIVVLISWLCSALGVQAVNPANGETVAAVNLFSVFGIQYLWTNVITNFSGFAPLGMVLVAVIGSSVAEKSGFLVCLMERFLGGAKGWVVTMVVIFLGINLNIAGDAGFIILPPLAAILYMSIGRSPMLGLYVAFASVAAGFCANILLGLSDALAYGFTEAAAKMIDPNYSASIAINWYFLIVSCVVLTIAGTILTEKVMVHRFPITKEELARYDFDENAANVTPEQKKALGVAGIAFVIYIAVILLLSLPVFGNPILGDENGSITSGAAPFTKGIVFTVTLALMVPGIAYGVAIGKYKNDKDVWTDISQGFADMGNYVFMCFFISIFTNFFSVSKLGTILAISGANGLKAIGFTGVPLMVGLIVVACFVNLFIGSASAKWAILAPVFVPMMMLMGYDPAITQVVYRIGDSITNPLSPLFTYMPVILGYARKYDKKAGLGSVIANMIPFSVTFAIVWIIQVIIWVGLNLPLGPGGGIYLG